MATRLGTTIDRKHSVRPSERPLRSGRRLIQRILKRAIPWNFRPPDNVPRRLLAAFGYYRLRTWAGARGEHVADSKLYQPMFSPWLGLSDFERYYALIHDHTMVRRDSCYVLQKSLEQALRLDGDVVECGVYRGGTALLESMVIASAGQARRLHLFDSFQGMPETTPGLDQFARGDFRKTSATAVASLLRHYDFVTMHVGFIPDTFGSLKVPRIVWAHIDLDIYQSIVDAIEWIYPRLVPGGFLIFDDYGYPSCAGARRAVDQSFAGRPEVPICLPTGQCLVVKLGHDNGERIVGGSTRGLNGRVP
jgi:O-methyltransferase